MKRTKVIVCLAIVIIMCISCGTYMNMKKFGIGRNTYPLGGIASDAVLLVSPFIAFAIIDLPFTVVGDIVTLPIILIEKPYCDKSKSSGPSIDGGFLFSN